MIRWGQVSTWLLHSIQYEFVSFLGKNTFLLWLSTILCISRFEEMCDLSINHPFGVPKVVGDFVVCLFENKPFLGILYCGLFYSSFVNFISSLSCGIMIRNFSHIGIMQEKLPRKGGGSCNLINGQQFYMNWE